MQQRLPLLIVLVACSLDDVSTIAQKCEHEVACDAEEHSVSLLQTALTHSSTKLRSKTHSDRRRSQIEVALRPATPEPTINPEFAYVHMVYVTSMNSTGDRDFGLMASMLSASRNMKHPGNLTIHLITPPEDRNLTEKFVQCFAEQFGNETQPTVKLYDLRPVRVDIGKQSHAQQLAGVTETYVRWYLGEYLPNVSRVIYIDTDTIIQDDITEMYSMDLKDSIIAAKHARYPLGNNYKTSLGALPHELWDSTVIQAGILVMDLDRWRSENVLMALEETARKVKELDNGNVDDQLVLSIVFHTNFTAARLNWRWNNEGPGFVAGCDFTVNEAAILHWSGPFKAWDYPPWYPCRSFKQYKPTVACPA